MPKSPRRFRLWTTRNPMAARAVIGEGIKFSDGYVAYRAAQVAGAETACFLDMTDFQDREWWFRHAELEWLDGTSP